MLRSNPGTGVDRSVIRLGVLALVAALPGPGSADAQTQAPPANRTGEIVRITPGARYDRGGLYRSIFGERHRDVWATAVDIPVLDLETFAGGLVPVRAHAGSQTRSLRFEGADGRTYQFRSVDKDPLARLSPDLRDTFTGEVLQDGVSSSYPYSSVVASAVLEAVGVLHVKQTLALLPDSPALGEFREDFAGMFGMIEERPDENDFEDAAYQGAIQVTGPTRLFERISDSPDDQVDALSFLTARLADIFMGDRDRHRDQFRWARFDDSTPSMWQPISRDHDEAFVNIDGPAMGLLRIYYPQLVAFSDAYPSMARLNWHSREVDRRFLVGLDRAVWDSVSTAMQDALTDEVLEAAMREIPAAAYEAGGDEMLAALQRRRDNLNDEALGYYDFLSEQVAISATDARERAEITRVDDRWLDLTIRTRGDGAEPYYRRRFDGEVTREITLRMWGKDDVIVVRGDGSVPIKLRVVGGHGDDLLADSSRIGGVQFFDSFGHNRVESPNKVDFDERPYEEWVGHDLDRYPPREWGTWWRPIPWVGVSSDYGLFIGGGFLRDSYGFRKSPNASAMDVRAGYATAANAAKFDVGATVHRENSSLYYRLHARMSGLEILRYYGLGNDTEAPEGSEFYKAKQQRLTFEADAFYPVGERGRVFVGAGMNWSQTGQNPGRFINTVIDTLYGAGDLGQLEARAGLELDRRDVEGAAHSGVHLTAIGRVIPGTWDVRSTFGTLDGDLAGFLTGNHQFAPTLALRVGGRKTWGSEIPFHEAAYIGGRASLRGYDSHRFAGDASLYGSVEVRQPLARFSIVLPQDVGISLLGDAGRVWLAGESPGGWHTAWGGGVWISFQQLIGSTLTVEVMTGDERTAFYLGMGFAF